MTLDFAPARAGGVRALVPGDVPVLSRLWLDAFKRGGSPAAVERYFEDVFVRPGWAGAATSLVHEERDGSISGFIGAIPREMLFRGRAVSAVVATQLMVDAGKHSAFVAFRLVRALFSGPQELTFSDGANELSAAVWQRSGGEIARTYCLDWQRVLRPVSHARERFAGRYARLERARLLVPACTLLDRAGERLDAGPLRAPRTTLDEVEATPAAMLEALETSDHDLRIAHDADSLAWVLRAAAETNGHGQLRARVCLGAAGKPVGFYVYYANDGGTSRVLQVYGQPRSMQAVLENLFADALLQGSVAITGQNEPRFMMELSASRASFSCKSLGVLVHARDPAILASIHRGDALLTRLDGEWWLRFAADRLT